MVDISYKQYKMLKEINCHNSYNSIHLTAEDLEICDFLQRNQFITTRIKRDNIDDKIYNEYRVTQSGKAQIYTFKSKFYKTRTSLILSVFSTFAAITSSVIAIIALMQN